MRRVWHGMTVFGQIVSYYSHIGRVRVNFNVKGAGRSSQLGLRWLIDLFVFNSCRNGLYIIMSGFTLVRSACIFGRIDRDFKLNRELMILTGVIPYVRRVDLLDFNDFVRELWEKAEWWRWSLPPCRKGRAECIIVFISGLLERWSCCWPDWAGVGSKPPTFVCLHWSQ